MASGPPPASYGAGGAPYGQPHRMTVATPLLPGWSEHIGPQGQLYWYNASTQQSTYTRPSSGPPRPPPSSPPVMPGPNGLPVYSGPPPGFAPPAGPSSALQQSRGPGVDQKVVAPTPLKEKPARKQPIPGADGWLEVTTNMGNVFYTHVPSKRSEWTVPDEIREQINEWKSSERKAEAERSRLEKEAREKQELERRRREEEENKEHLRKAEEVRKQRERQRMKAEEEAQKRQREQEQIHADRIRILQEASKRKRDDDERDGDGQHPSEEARESSVDTEKRARLNETDDEEDEDEESWQRQIAAEMAQEASAPDIGSEAISQQPVAAQQSPSHPPPQVELALEESKAIFLHMLTLLNGTPNEVNPMAPWDRELPKFVHQRDYTVLTSLRDRQDAFNDWCRLRLRDKRKGSSGPVSETARQPQAPPHVAQPLVSNGSSEGISTKRENFRSLLEAEVKSTRTRWEDFRKAWKRDRRFFEYGRDEREREKAFRDWLKELGEKKRRAAEEAEDEFLRLLTEKLVNESRLSRQASTTEGNERWTRAKRTPGLDHDPRYDAVGSSSRRAELYIDWAKGLRRAGDTSFRKLEEPQHSTGKQQDKERAMREREEQVRRQRRAAEQQKSRTLGQAVHEESRINFQQLLVDAVRDPLARLQDAFPDLARDDRFHAQGLHDEEKRSLFARHVDVLNERRLRELEKVFERHAPALDVEDDVALPLIRNDDEIERKKLDHIKDISMHHKTLGEVFNEWTRRREDLARKSFMEMLRETAFVDFWGRLRQEVAQKKASGQGQNAEADASMAGDGGDDDEESDLPNLLQMAGQIDLDEIHAVLRHDQRYRAWRHRPELREEWIRHHLQNMEAAKMTVFQKS